MTSERQISANRTNATRSTGPRTREGKSQASRNALRHGLAAADFGDSGVSGQVERLAKAICKDEKDPFRYEQAVIVAESQIFLARVRAARIATIERHRKPGSSFEHHPNIPFPNRGEVDAALKALAGGHVRPAIKLVKRMSASFDLTPS
jgi:hypothetical protein